MKIYVAIDLNDKYELPVAIADTQAELARILGVSRNTVASSLNHVKEGRMKRSRYLEVELDE